MMAEAEEKAGDESPQQAEGGSMEKERPRPPQEPQMCPRCDSMNTKFCYYNNYSLSQPRYFCKNCKRYWTKGGALRNVPFGGSYRKGNRQRRSGGPCATTLTNQEGSTIVPSSLDLQQQLQNHFLLDKNRSVLAVCGDSGGGQVVHSALYGLGGLEEGGEGYYAPHPTMQTLNPPITASLIDLQPSPTLTYRLPPLHHHAFPFPFQTNTPPPQNHPNRSHFTGVFLPMIAGASSSTTPPYTWHQRPVNPNSSSTTTTIDAPTITTTSGVGASGVWVPPSSSPFV